MQAYPAFPRVRGEGFHGWLEAEGVVALITGVADQHLCVFPWISAAVSVTGHFKELSFLMQSQKSSEPVFLRRNIQCKSDAKPQKVVVFF